MVYCSLTKGLPSVCRLAQRSSCNFTSVATNTCVSRLAPASATPARPASGLTSRSKKETGRKLSSFVVMAGCQIAPATAPNSHELATFAGGCFWGTELAFQRVPGVAKTFAGYTQGQQKGPTYESVCSGRSGHTEAILVEYDPKECSYDSLLTAFFASVDPTTVNQQGGDMGTQYRSGIYYHNDEQKVAAEKAIAKANEQLQNGSFRRVRGGKKVVSELLPATDFYIAEDYHQQYLEKGGRFGRPQNASKGASEPIRCYG
ncbi:hypothetical protein WJX84_002566 [Apatococcus fuscideae]|uniref:peptide-methionine (S)-S-oxide reductase n=1 Tax=Apatococcus fuscideae TaxID=2026836 RepID=A0AAW1TCR0_9CHLO